MTPLATTLSRVAAALGNIPAPFALVGGLAVSVRTEPRFTRDIDLAVAVGSDMEAEQIIHRLRGLGFLPAGHLEQEAMGRLATVRLSTTAGAAPVVDLLFASSGIEPEVVAASETLEVLPHVSVPVARIPHLLALKVLSRDDRTRPQDRVDLLALLRVAVTAEMNEARDLCRLIQARGFARGRDLVADLARV